MPPATNSNSNTVSAPLADSDQTDNNKPSNIVASCDTQQTVCFEDDKPVIASIRSGDMVNTMLDSSIKEQREHSLKDFLSRPILVDKPSWTTSQTAGTAINSYNFPEAFLASPMYAAKITNFLGFRAKLVFRFVINTHRFQQGRLLFTWFPQGQINSPRYDLSLSHLTLATQLPRREYDAASSTDVFFEVPYVSPTTHYNVVRQTGPFGVLSVLVYSPLIAPSGTTSANIQVWAYCKDVELDYPARPHASSPMTKRTRNLVMGESDREANAATPGVISTTLSGMSIISEGLSSIPSLSSVFKPLAWVTLVLSKTAASFGWSKPKLTAAQNRVHPNPFAYMANVNSIDSSTSLGVFSDAQVCEYPNFTGTDLDEMAIQFVAQVPAFIDSFSWTTSNAQDVALFSYNIEPLSFFKTAVVSGITVNYPVPLSYLANVFRYWRGSVTFIFKVIKTEFHSGRLIFVFDPSGDGYPAPTVANSEGMYRRVFDLRESNEFVVTVPFVSTTPYNKVGENAGVVHLLVDTPLQAIGQVNSSVSVLLELAGGPDFEFEVPVSTTQIPVMPGITPSFASDDVVFAPEALGQNVTVDSVPLQVAPFELIGSKPAVKDVLPASLCIGEKITSLRQLIKRFVIRDAFSTGNIYAIAFSANTQKVNQFPAPANVTVLDNIDYIDYFGMMYNYRRGGVRLKTHVYNSTISNLKLLAGTYSQSIVAVSAVSSTALSGTQQGSLFGTTIGFDGINGGIEIENPQYGQVPMFINYPHLSFTGPTGQQFESDRHVIIASAIPSSLWRNYRAAADDFAFGFFLGSVPTVAATNYFNTSNSWA